MNLAGLHEKALVATGALIGRVADDQWQLRSTCDDWTVRELVNHIVAGNLWVVELAGRGRTIDEVGSRLDGDMLGTDARRAYDESARLAAETFSSVGVMEKPCAVSYGPVPGEVYAGHRLLDVLVHGWDVAQSTGQAASLDPQLVEGCWNVIEPQAAGLRASGAFKTDVDVPADAGLQTRLLALVGRRG
jgi:uncharacterized protein (TIGR03086 family)